MICCVCAAILENGYSLADFSIRVTMYEGSAYCLDHLPHIEEAVGILRKLDRERDLERKTVT